MTSDKQREANRINAQKSTGPRTAEGKARSKHNALTHGLRAETLDVLPNEDPEAYRARVDAWIDDYRPAGAAEEALVRHAADTSWKLDRIRRHETAHLSLRVEDAAASVERARRDRIERTRAALLPTEAEVVRFGLDRADASRLVADLSATADGCQWLIDAWRGLRALVSGGQFWTSEQELHVIRLLGGGPDPIGDPGIVDLIVANRTLLHAQAHVKAPLTPETWSDAIRRTCFIREAVLSAIARKPATPAEASARLTAAADREIDRLEETLALRERDGDLDNPDAEIAAALASFDPSAEGERLRRYQFSLARELARTIDTLAKLRRDRMKRNADRAEAIGANEANSGEDPGEDRPDEAPPAPIEPISELDVGFASQPSTTS